MVLYTHSLSSLFPRIHLYTWILTYSPILRACVSPWRFTFLSRIHYYVYMHALRCHLFFLHLPLFLLSFFSSFRPQMKMFQSLRARTQSESPTQIFSVSAESRAITTGSHKSWRSGWSGSTAGSTTLLPVALRNATFANIGFIKYVQLTSAFESCRECCNIIIDDIIELKLD